MTLPNLITILRIVLVPVFIIYIIDNKHLGSLIVFVIASVSDALDGFIARIFKQKSSLGAYLDPLADKILLMSAFICLAILKMIPSWLAVVTISRDIIIMLGILVIYLTGHEVKIKPSGLSKITTCAQVFTVLAVLAHGYLNVRFLEPYFFWIVAVLTVTSGFQYIRKGLIIIG